MVVFGAHLPFPPASRRWCWSTCSRMLEVATSGERVRARKRNGASHQWLMASLRCAGCIVVDCGSMLSGSLLHKQIRSVSTDRHQCVVTYPCSSPPCFSLSEVICLSFLLVQASSGVALTCLLNILCRLLVLLTDIMPWP